MKRDYIKKYYQEYMDSIILPDRPTFRQFKLLLKDRRWYTIPVQINSKGKLQKYLLKYAPEKVFHTIARWTNPHKLKSKYYAGSGYKHESNFIRANLFFDFDFYNPDKVKKCIKAIKKDKELTLLTINFSGSRGFHIVCDTNKKLFGITDYQDFINRKYEEYRRFGIDMNTGDIRRIKKLIGSLDGSSGLICNEIKEKDLSSFMPYCYDANSEGGFVKKSMTLDIGHKPVSARQNQFSRERTHNDSLPIYAMYLTNRVKNSFYPLDLKSMTLDIGHKPVSARQNQFSRERTHNDSLPIYAMYLTNRVKNSFYP